MTPTPFKHPLVTRVLHWAGVAMLGYGYLTGLEDVDQLQNPTLLRREVLF